MELLLHTPLFVCNLAKKKKKEKSSKISIFILLSSSSNNFSKATYRPTVEIMASCGEIYSIFFVNLSIF